MTRPLRAPPNDVLQKLYWEDRLSFNNIGEKLGVSKGAVRYWWKHYGLTSRERLEGIKAHYHQDATEKGLESERTDEEKRLLALAIEFEGSIGLLKHNRRTGPRYRASIQVANTRMELLRYVSSLAKMGGITPRKPNLTQPNHKPSWTWYVHNLFLVEKLLAELEPYLITKREQARLVLDFCRLRLKNYHVPFGEQEAVIHQRLKALNHRGLK